MENNKITQNEKHLLEVKNLRVSFFMNSSEIKAVDNVSYYVNKKEIVAIVGESGCGKSVTQMSTMQLLQSPPGKIMGGEILFQGDNLLKYRANSKKMQAMRGAQISMIFQEPMTSLNPTFTVGNQLVEVIRKHKKVSKKEAWNIGVQSLKAVDIPDPEQRMKNYPFEMSGGMRQRVLIAISVACHSKLIIADEPTTALDVTTQAQVMDLLENIVKEMQTSLIVVTHNLGLVSRYANRIYVMYAGRVVESGTTEDLLKEPKHPYTIGLLKSVPKLNDDKDKELIQIEGNPPNLADMPATCAFLPRCPYACDKCKNNDYPQLREVGSNLHYTACHIDVNYETQNR